MSPAENEHPEAGSGHTYSPWRAGQAFDVTNLPNGIYNVEVRANLAVDS